jgi:hypothetical protein
MTTRQSAERCSFFYDRSEFKIILESVFHILVLFLFVHSATKCKFIETSGVASFGILFMAFLLLLSHVRQCHPSPPFAFTFTFFEFHVDHIDDDILFDLRRNHY